MMNFGPHLIPKSTVFANTPLSFAFVNLRPFVPDVLVAPVRVVARFGDLAGNEVSDLWLTAQRVGDVIQRHTKCSSLQFAIQDGVDAGQTVPHVHIHVVPRTGGDFARNDDVYTEIEKSERTIQEALDNDKRTNRPLSDMEHEAAILRQLFDSL